MLDHGFKTLSLRRVCQVLMAVALIWGLAGCQTEPLRPADSGDQPAAQVVYQPGGVRLVSVDLDQQIAAPNSQPPAATDPSANQPINLDAARNEWVSYTVQIDDLPGASSRQNWVVSLTPLRPATGSASLISAENFVCRRFCPCRWMSTAPVMSAIPVFRGQRAACRVRCCR